MKYVFILDPGHREDTPGKRANGLYEYEFNQDVAEKTKPLLAQYGDVYFSITTEKHPYSENTKDGRTKNLKYRCDVANTIYNDYKKKYGEDNLKCVFVSIHANAADNTSASGYEVYVYKKTLESYKIAQSIHNAAKDILGVGKTINDRGIKENDYYVLKHTSMSAFLIEHEFYTNVDAVKKLKDDNFRQKCAEHIVSGLINYYGIKKQPAQQDKPNTSKKSKFYKKDDAYIIETTPDNIEIKILGNTLHQAGVYGVNGTFFETKKPTLTRSCWGIATMNGKALGENSMLVNYNKTIKRGTIIYFKDGTIGNKKVNNINEFWKPHIWSISGYTILPYIDFAGEKIENGVNYKTAHTYLGYNTAGKIFLIVKPNHMPSEILPLLKQLGLRGCILLDGGGSSQLNHPDGSYKSTRKINSAILLKQI